MNQHMHTGRPRISSRSCIGWIYFSDRPFKKSSESSFMFHNEAISLLSNFRRSNSSLLCSLQPCLLCALCLRFATLCISYLQNLSSRFQFDCTPRSLSFCADLAGIGRSQTRGPRFTAVHDGAFHALDVHQDWTREWRKRAKGRSSFHFQTSSCWGLQVRRWEGPQYRKLSAEMLQESQTSCAHVHCFSWFSAYLLNSHTYIM